MNATISRGLARGFLAALLGAVPLVAGSQSPETVSVTVQRLAELHEYPQYSAPATVLSLNDSYVSAEIHGVIERIAVRPGDTVEADAELVAIDCRDHRLAVRVPRAQLDAAEAERDLADYRLERATKLREREAMPLGTFQERRAAALEASAQVRQLQARLRSRERTVGKCSVGAPFPAVVVERTASVGELAAPGTRLLRLVDTQALEVSSQIQEQDLADLREAPRIRFASRGRRYPVTLRGVIPVLDRRVSSYEARLRFPGERPAPGESGRLHWRDDRPHVPADLLVERDGRLGVFLRGEDGRARFHAVPGAEPGKPAPLALAPDTWVIVEGRHGLRDGERVEPVEP